MCPLNISMGSPSSPKIPDQGRTGRSTDLAQILHVNLVRGSNHEMDIFRLK